MVLAIVFTVYATLKLPIMIMMINSVAWRQQDEKENSYRPGGDSILWLGR